MANQTFLVTGDEVCLGGDIPDELIVAAANYMIPVFWYSLFREGDARSITVECDDGEPYTYTAYTANRREALRLSRQRWPALAQVLDGLAGSWYVKWADFVEASPGEFVYIETLELTIMADSDAYTDESLRCIGAFSEPPLLKKGIFRRAALRESWRFLLHETAVTTSTSVINASLLCGYSWGRDVPWDTGQ
ncbi:MAG: hypothetical protein JW818_20745 [Pirellulales bacterium]|nr:hypothetical protein [Pirellulales bacterium]